MDNIPLTEYVEEATEIIERTSQNLFKFEKEKFNDDSLNEIYRDIHTLKGSSFLFGINHIGKMAHTLESSLDYFRKNQINFNENFIKLFFHTINLSEQIIETLKKGEQVDDFEQDVKLHLVDLAEAILDLSNGKFKLNVTDSIFQESLLLDNTIKKEEPKMTKQAVPSEKTERPAENIDDKNAKSPQKAAIAPVDSTVRVQVGILDKLMNLVGEIVLVRNQVLQYANDTEDLEFLNLSQNLDIVTSDLQSEVMKTRMQPIGTILKKFTRVVRDIASDLSKKIDVTLEGTETELDKTLLEAIKDPLTHLIRNACDHGIEVPEDRVKAGKSETGKIVIKAYHEGGQIVIEINDDGKGISKDVILSKAIEKGLLKESEASQYPPHEILNFIFMPGFSTAKQVSNVSGRGVGMDVVRTNIEKIGGSVEIRSQEGEGSQFRMKIPLTLAIVPALIVKSHQRKYAIPQVKLVELVRVDNDESNEHNIEFLQGRPVFRLRGNLLPLVSLKEILSKSKEYVFQEKDINDLDSINIVVLNADGKFFGLIVDEILDTTDIVVKPLGQILKNISSFSGATILGDGTVALILDVIGIAQKTQIGHKKEGTQKASSNAEQSKLEDISNIPRQEFLLFKLNAAGKYSIPLCLVHRLEEFPRSSIEYTGEQAVIRYRGEILPVISINNFLQFENGSDNLNNDDLKVSETEIKTDDHAEEERFSAIVVQKQERSYGLMVNNILDVVNIFGEIDDAVNDRQGILGNILHEEEVIVVLDILKILDIEIGKLQKNAPSLETTINVAQTVNAIPVAGNQLPHTQGAITSGKFHVLLVEDTIFFQKQISKFLNKNNFDFKVAGDGQDAIKVLEEETERPFDLILTDIEMPKMNGIEFTQAVRQHEKFKHLPIIAITTKYKEEYIKEGLDAGIDLYLEKLNPDQLLKGIHETLNKK